MLVLAERLRLLREQKSFTQGDIESRTGLRRCYISRVERGRTIPSLETLEKLAHSLDLPLYQFLYDGEVPPTRLKFTTGKRTVSLWGSSGKDGYYFDKLRACLSRMSPEDRDMLLRVARIMLSVRRKSISMRTAKSPTTVR